VIAIERAGLALNALARDGVNVDDEGDSSSLISKALRSRRTPTSIVASGFNAHRASLSASPPRAFRTRTRTNTKPNDTEANAAGRRGVRVRSTKSTCENQGAWVAKSLTKSEALVGGARSENA
jgi:hypothetical protein